MSEDALKARINDLKVDLERKDMEIHNLLDRIEELEDNIMRLEALIPEEDTTKKSRKQQAVDSKLAIELDEKDRQLRELKNSMGFLRKEKVQLQQELNAIKSQQNESSVIRVEDLRSAPPLNMLVKELQDKVNNYRSIINKLRSQSVGSEELSEKLNQREKEIEILKSENLKLEQKLMEFDVNSSKKSQSLIQKELIEDLQGQLTKSKKQITDLKLTIAKSDKSSKKYEKDITKIKDFKKEINTQKDLVKEREDEIKRLKKDIISLQKAEISANFEQDDIASNQMMKTLQEDLQNKLNKAKQRIQTLKSELKEIKKVKPIESTQPQGELEEKLKMQREMAIFLQKQLKTKEEEIETIKNEAVQIKGKYRQLENQLRLKEEKLSDLQRQLDSFNIQNQVQQVREDPDLDLRVRELKNRLENLEKLNNEHKLEIAQLRKRT
ncbi:MAG: hypothetical protein ACFFE5_04965 [Candidatus Thorarchaeota archaeon]